MSKNYPLIPSLHPADDPLLFEYLQEGHDEEIKGGKMHPYFQLEETRIEV